jgi:hypothetical protein
MTMSGLHPIFDQLLQQHFDAAESRHYRAIDAAEARQEWIDGRVTELMAGDLAAEIGEFAFTDYEAFTVALNAVLRGGDVDALLDVFGAHFQKQAEREYDRKGENE